MNINHYAILEGKKVVLTSDVKKWATFMGETRIVKKTNIQPNIEVSTVFLGTNHGYGGNDLWFETMVFSVGFFFSDIDSRYATWEEAEKGHNAAVETVRERLKNLGKAIEWSDEAVE